MQSSGSEDIFDDVERKPSERRPFTRTFVVTFEFLTSAPRGKTWEEMKRKNLVTDLKVTVTLHGWSA